MHCPTCRYELSQCLDGRLPSGRRAIVMQHVASCKDCGTFWTDLQAAQQLSLQLPPQRVSEGFREQLWERIRAGEGTPEAVFREPVPLLVKVRYALTGAAAAAAALLCMTLLREERVDRLHPVTDVASGQSAPTQYESGQYGSGAVDQATLLASMQRFRLNVLAGETAKQLEQHYASASQALRRLEAEPLEAGGGNSEVAIRQVLENADEIYTFGEVLLDLRKSDWLVFTDEEVGADLRLAVDMLGQGRLERRNRDTVRAFVAPALRSSRLASVSRSIGVKQLDPRQEMDVLVRLNTQRPWVFPKLFIVFGTDDDLCHDLGLFRTGGAFAIQDQCGPSWVAPRSEVEALDGRLRIMRPRIGSGSQGIEVQIRKAGTK